MTVNYGGSQTFSFTPDTGYHVADVLVDGTSVGAAPNYAFTNVTANHTIEVTLRHQHLHPDPQRPGPTAASRPPAR